MGQQLRGVSNDGVLIGVRGEGGWRVNVVARHRHDRALTEGSFHLDSRCQCVGGDQNCKRRVEFFIENLQNERQCSGG